jgi:type IV secretory pathway VirB4 component
MVDGEYINFTFNSDAKINPFDLSQVYEEGQNELGQKVLSLHGLLKVMLGEMNAEQEALLDRALIATYKAKGITPDPITQKNTPPLMEDLYKTVIGMESAEADDIAARLEKFITGSFRGIFDQGSNINITNEFTVFSVKEMEDSLRPIAMYVILDFIWTRVKKSLKKRLLIIDEAWYFMQHPDSARFIYSMTKRARKYFLGITTITQDVEDFLHNDYGKAIVSNASIKFLMKQSSASIPVLAETFYLSEGEQQLLVSADVGEGVFFAGQNHVALRVVASPEEHQVITTDPREISAKRKTVLHQAGMGEEGEVSQQPDESSSRPEAQGRVGLPSKSNFPSLFSSQQKNESNLVEKNTSAQPETNSQDISQPANQESQARLGEYPISDYKTPNQ